MDNGRRRPIGHLVSRITDQEGIYGIARRTPEVRDDGGGLTLQAKKGVGLTSMRERAEELGGTWLVEPIQSGGTRIFVQLPYTLAASLPPNPIP